MKRIISFVLVFAAAGMLGLGALQARAENIPQPESRLVAKQLDANISMTVRFDFDDMVRLDHPIPAFIEIDNKGADTEAAVRIVQGNNTLHAYETQVQLPAGVTRVTVPFFALSGTADIDVQLLRGDSIVAVAKKNRGVSHTTAPLVGILSGNPEGMEPYCANVLSLRTAGAQALDVSTVGIPAEDFPEQVFMLDRFALVILNHFDLSLLDSTQQDALAQWVQNGGRLLVDADAGNAPALQSLQPIIELRAAGGFAAPSAIEQLGAASGHTYPWDKELQGLAKVAPAGDIVLGSEESPLVTRHSAGAGAVFVTAFALDDPLFQGTKASEVFEEIAGLSAPDSSHTTNSILSSESMYTSNAVAMLDAASSIEWLDAPGVGSIVLILVIFIVIAAPLSYIILARLDKRDWIWVTTPALAVICCVLIMGFGIGKHGNQTVSSVVSVVDFRHSQGAVQSYSLVGIGAPREGRYDVQLEEDAVPLKAGTQEYYNTFYSAAPAVASDKADPTLTFDTSAYPQARFSNIRQWGMDSFMVRRDIPTEGRLEADILYEDAASAHYTVKNNTGAALEDVIVLSHLGYAEIPLLESGEEKSGALAKYDNSSMFSINNTYLVADVRYSELLNAYYETVFKPDYSLKNDDERREAYLRGRVLNTFMENAAFSGAGASLTYYLPDDAIVAGWSRELGALPLKVNGKNAKNELNRTLVLSSADIAYEGVENLSTPIASAEGVITGAQNVVDGYAEIGESSLYFGEGEATFSFDLAVNKDDYAIDGLIIVPEYEYGAYETFLYNNETGLWDGLDLHEGLSGEAINSYLDADGVVLLKITAAATGDYDPVSYDYPVLTIMGGGRDDA